MKRGRPREITGPTPETERKLVPDVIHEMVLENFLEGYHEDAAREIEKVYLSLTIIPRQSDVRLNNAAGFLCPLSRLSPNVERIWRERYAPWANAVGRAAEYVFNAKINNIPPQGGEREIVKSCLEAYALIAGMRVKKCA